MDIHTLPSCPILQAVLPLPPGVNHSYRIVRTGKFHRLAATPALVLFKNEAKSALFKTGQINWATVTMIRESKKKMALQAKVMFFFPTLWRSDVDGGIKAVVDAAFNYINLNDNLVVELVALKRTDASNPRCEISIHFAELGG